MAAHLTLIHGLANKPPASDLLRIWLEALADPREDDDGLDPGAIGITTSLVYWADEFYDAPSDPAEYESVDELADLELQAGGSVVATDKRFLKAYGVPEEAWERADEEAVEETSDAEFERIPLPRPLKLKMLKHAAREAHDYLLDVGGVRGRIRQRVLDDFARVPQGATHVVLGHSQGSFIAYDVLTRVPQAKAVHGLMTVGSPLGIDEIQDELEVSRETGFPAKVSGDWVNVYDPLDAVARLDPNLENDFLDGGERRVIDVSESNWGKWRHSATKYFKGKQLRAHLRRQLGVGR
jgi:hypothetical protein